MFRVVFLILIWTGPAFAVICDDFVEADGNPVSRFNATTYHRKMSVRSGRDTFLGHILESIDGRDQIGFRDYRFRDFLKADLGHGSVMTLVSAQASHELYEMKTNELRLLRSIEKSFRGPYALVATSAYRTNFFYLGRLSDRKWTSARIAAARTREIDVEKVEVAYVALVQDAPVPENDLPHAVVLPIEAVRIGGYDKMDSDDALGKGLWVGVEFPFQPSVRSRLKRGRPTKVHLLDSNFNRVLTFKTRRSWLRNAYDKLLSAD